MCIKGRSKYRWEDIQADWEVGRSYKYLTAKYKIPLNTVKTRIFKYKWKRDVTVIEATKELEATTVVLQTVAQDGSNPAKRDAVQLLVTEVVSRAELIASNQVLVRQAQMVLAQGFVDEKVTLDNLKDVTHTIKNMDSVVNPNAKLGTLPNNLPPTVINMTKAEVKQSLLDDGVPLDLLEHLIN